MIRTNEDTVVILGDNSDDTSVWGFDIPSQTWRSMKQFSEAHKQIVLFYNRL